MLDSLFFVTHLWYSSTNYKPGFLAHKQEVVAQKYSVFLFISCQEGEELLKPKKRNINFKVLALFWCVATVWKRLQLHHRWSRGHSYQKMKLYPVTTGWVKQIGQPWTMQRKRIKAEIVTYCGFKSTCLATDLIALTVASWVLLGNISSISWGGLSGRMYRVMKTVFPLRSITVVRQGLSGWLWAASLSNLSEASSKLSSSWLSNWRRNTFVI